MAYVMWTRNAERLLKDFKGKVTEVVQLTERSEAGVCYSVRISVSEVVVAEEWRRDDQFEVWTTDVEFSHSNSSGGPAFVAAAREQERAAHEVWERTR